MTFEPTASTAQDQISGALLLLLGAKRGAKRHTQFLSI
jgi:hypothetical protein